MTAGHPRLRVATVSTSIHVQHCPSRTINEKRPNASMTLGRFLLPSRDVR